MRINGTDTAPAPADALSVGALLSKPETPASALLGRIRRLELIQTLVRDWAQNPLASALRIANERDGIVVLYADSAAAATQLRFRQHELREHLRERLGDGRLGLEIRVRPASQTGVAGRV